MAPPPTFWDGIAQFNHGDFYTCHDTLEAIWMVADTVDKPFYQGILQIAVGLYHLSNHNWRGAAILLGEGSRRLEPYEPLYHEVEVTHLLDWAAEWLLALQQLGPEQVAVVAAALATGTAVPLPPEEAVAGETEWILPAPKIHCFS